MLGASALGRPRGMVWGGRREEGSGWGTHVYLWRIHFDIWQNEYNFVKFKNKKKKKKKELVPGLFSNVNLTRSPSSTRKKFLLDVPTQAWQTLLWGMTISPRYYLLGFPCFSGLHSSHLFVSQQNYGEMVWRSLCPHETRNSIREADKPATS